MYIIAGMRRAIQSHKEIILVFVILLVSLFVSEFKFIIGNLYNRPETVYLGTTHVANDYMYYLSQVVQGQTRWFCGEILQTTDYPGCVYVGWVNVLMGRLFYLLGFNQIWAYQLACMVWFLGLGGVGYWMIYEVDRAGIAGNWNKREKWGKRILALVFFLFATSMPKIITTTTGCPASFKLCGIENIGYYDYWYNIGNRMVRFVTIPHHLIGQFFLGLALILTVCYTKIKGLPLRSIVSFLLLVSGFVLASVNTVQWAMGVGVMGLAFLVSGVKRINGIGGLSGGTMRLMKDLLPVVIFGLGGLPMSLYMKSLLSRLPYTQMVEWEATTPLSHTPPLLFFLGYGPILILAIIGIVFVLRKITPARLIVVIFPLLSFGIFFSPIPGTLRMSGARFIPYVTSLFLGILGAEGVMGLREIGGSNWIRGTGRIVSIILLVGFVVLTIPTYIAQAKEILATDRNDVFIFLPKPAMEIFDYIKTNTKITDTFLVNWPFHTILPAMTGRHGYWGDYLMTVDSVRKEGEAQMFFYTPLADSNLRTDLLKRAKIDYVLAYPWMEQLANHPCLNIVKGNYLLNLYRVGCR
jgi:hypothetical protein